MLKVLIANDQPIIRRGIRQILLEEFSFVEVEEVAQCDELMLKVKNSIWDVILADLSIPCILDTLKEIKQEREKLPILILNSGNEDRFSIKAVHQSADGYLHQNAEAAELIKAINLVLTGKKYMSPGDDYSNLDGSPHEKLSDRELHVFRLLAAGKTVAEIGRILSLRSNTVSTYRTRLLGKMSMRTNADLLRYAMEHNLF
jgi:two-component system invasion response regulator UvrY